MQTRRHQCRKGLPRIRFRQSKNLLSPLAARADRKKGAEAAPRASRFDRSPSGARWARTKLLWLKSRVKQERGRGLPRLAVVDHWCCGNSCRSTRSRLVSHAVVNAARFAHSRRQPGELFIREVELVVPPQQLTALGHDLVEPGAFQQSQLYGL